MKCILKKLPQNKFVKKEQLKFRENIISDLAKALSSMDQDSLIQMAKSHCATKVASVIINTKPLKAKVAELESFKSMEMVEALPEDAKKEMLEMFDTAIEACREMSKIRKKY